MTEAAEKPSTDLTKREEELAAAAMSDVKQEDLVLPQIKLLQNNSREVQGKDAEHEAGTYLNSLTGDNYGPSFELVTVFHFKGRFYAPEDEERVYVAASDVAPTNWPDEFAGKPFADIPLAEEQWKEKANDPDSDFQWGSGPPIQTTNNFIGFLPEEPGAPVRVSLKSTSNRAARKALSLLNAAGVPWAGTLRFTVDSAENKKKQPFFVVKVERGTQCDQATRELAMNMAEVARDAQFKLTGDAPEEKAAKPDKPKGGLDVA